MGGPGDSSPLPTPYLAVGNWKTVPCLHLLTRPLWHAVPRPAFAAPMPAWARVGPLWTSASLVDIAPLCARLNKWSLSPPPSSKVWGGLPGTHTHQGGRGRQSWPWRAGSGGSKQRDGVVGLDYSAELPGSQGKRELGQKRALLTEREDV